MTEKKKPGAGVLAEIAGAVSSAVGDFTREVKQDLKEMTPPAAGPKVNMEAASTVAASSAGLAHVDVGGEAGEVFIPESFVQARDLAAPWDAVLKPGRMCVDSCFVAASEEDIVRYAQCIAVEPDEPFTMGILAAEADDNEELATLLMALSKQSRLFGAVGYGPRHIQEDLDVLDETLTELLNSQPKLLALGLVGLDEPFAPYALPQQKEQLMLQLELAADFSLPAFVAHRRTFVPLAETLAACSALPKLVWSDPLETRDELELVRKLDMHVLIRPEITYSTTPTYAELLMEVPENRRLLAGGSALVAPEARSGHANGPESLGFTLKAYAALLDRPMAEVRDGLNRVARDLFVTA